MEPPQRQRFTSDPSLPAYLQPKEAACRAGTLDSCLPVAGAYRKGAVGMKKDAARAAVIYQYACQAGSLVACGLQCEFGLGVRKDESRAVTLYKKACDRGAAGGCNNLGVMHAIGRGVVKDESRAVLLYEQACDGGYASGCRNQGAMYAYGRGVVKDASRAVTLYNRRVMVGMRGCEPRSPVR